MILQTLQIELRPIDELVPYARNARTHSEAQIAQLAGSIDEFGFNNPVLVDANGGIIAGHGRLLAARKLGFTEVPVIVLRHLTENQKRAFMLADNKLALNAGWDEQMLRLELEALAGQDFGLELTGFDEQELADLLEAEEQNRLVDVDEAPGLQPQVVTIAGDMWELGSHRVLCGDGTRHEHVQRVLSGGFCSLVFTDLPYNVN